MEFNRRITDDIRSISDSVSGLVKSVMILCTFTIVSVITARYLFPNDNSMVLTIISLAGPIIAGLMTMAQKKLAAGMDGRMEQVIAMRGENKRLEGVIDTLAVTSVPEVSKLTPDAKREKDNGS